MQLDKVWMYTNVAAKGRERKEKWGRMRKGVDDNALYLLEGFVVLRCGGRESFRVITW